MESVVAALRALASEESFRQRYDASEEQKVILFPAP